MLTTTRVRPATDAVNASTSPRLAITPLAVRLRVVAVAAVSPWSSLRTGAPVAMILTSSWVWLAPEYSPDDHCDTGW